MTIETEATPRPWVEFADQGDTVAILPAMRNGTICHFAAPYPSRANAALIVRAVNSLDALVEALKAAQDHIGNGYQPPELVDQIARALSLASGEGK